MQVLALSSSEICAQFNSRTSSRHGCPPPVQTAGQWAISGGRLTIWTLVFGTLWCVGQDWTDASVAPSWASPWNPGPPVNLHLSECQGSHVDSRRKPINHYIVASWDTSDELLIIFNIWDWWALPWWDLMWPTYSTLRMINQQQRNSSMHHLLSLASAILNMR